MEIHSNFHKQGMKIGTLLSQVQGALQYGLQSGALQYGLQSGALQYGLECTW